MMKRFESCIRLGFIGVIALASCSKSDVIEPERKIGEQPTEQIRQMQGMTLTFSEELSSLELLYSTVATETTERPEAFIDLNGNRKFEANEEIPVAKDVTQKSFTIEKPTKVIRLYGDFATLKINNKGLKSIEGSGLGTLKELAFKDSEMSKAALNQLVAVLKPKGEAEERKISIDELLLSGEQIAALYGKGWQVNNAFGSPIDLYQDLAVLTVTGAKGRELTLPVNQAYPVDANCWVDTNLNNVKDEGEAEITKSSKEITIPLDANGNAKIAIRGKIEILKFGGLATGGAQHITYTVLRNNTLRKFEISGNIGLEALDIEAANNIKEITVEENPVKEFAYPKHELLTSIVLTSSQIEEIDFSTSPKLTRITMTNGRLKKFVMPRSNARLAVNVSNNQLTNLDLSQTPQIISLDASNNQLTEVTLWKEDNSTLQELNLSKNKLKEFSMKKLILADPVYLGGNELTTFDASPARKGHQILADLDLSGSSKLVSINCKESTNLTRINLSNCPAFNFSELPKALIDYSKDPYSAVTITVDDKAPITDADKKALKNLGWTVIVQN